MASYPNIMPHFHLPIQSGSNSILTKMNRHYTKEDYLEKIILLRSHIPQISITTDIIVGFPFESDEDFNETIEMIKQVSFDGAFTFMFSVRKGTPAEKFRVQIDQATKKRRLNELVKITNDLSLNKNKLMVDQVFEVLVESIAKKNNMLQGYTKNYKLVIFKGDTNLIGKLVNVRITNAKTWFILGELSDD